VTVDPEIVVYHGGCWDGFAAAATAYRAVTSGSGRDAPDLVPAFYGAAPPGGIDGRRVMICDFSFPAEVMVDIAARAAHVTWIDHHKTAIDAMTGKTAVLEAAGHEVIVDMGRSGAGLTWEYFHPDGPVPWPVRYVEDRDLWRRALPDHDAVTMWIRSHEMTLDSWGRILHTPLADAAVEGEAMAAYHRRLVENAADAGFWATIPGWEQPIPLAAASYTLGSDVSNVLLDRTGATVAGYLLHNTAGLVQYGLRSVAGVDCSVVATFHGGGGHPQACGWTSGEAAHTYIGPVAGSRP
jgi:hypothetical protein